MNTRHLFNNISGTYDLLNRVLSLGTDQMWRRRGTALLPHGENVRVLDLACGTLDMSLKYLRQGPGSVCAVDFSAPMMLTGRMKVSPTLDERLRLVCGDVMNLPFAENTFDAAMCAWGVRNFGDLRLNLREIRRALKPEGLFLVIEFFRPTRLISRIFSKTYGRHVIPALGRMISKNNEAYDYLHRSIEGFVSRAEYEMLLREEGFSVEKAKDMTGGVTSLILAKRA